MAHGGHLFFTFRSSFVSGLLQIVCFRPHKAVLKCLQVAWAHAVLPVLGIDGADVCVHDDRVCVVPLLP